MTEQETDGLFQQEPEDISRQYAGICAMVAMLSAVLTATGRAQMAAVFAILMLLSMAVSFYTITGPTVIGWKDVEDYE